MTQRRKFVAAFLPILLGALPYALFAASPDSFLFPFPVYVSTASSSEDAPQVLAQKSGTLPTKDGLRLRCNTDMGNLRIVTDTSGQISYRVTVEADPADPGAQKLLRELRVLARRTGEGITLESHVPWQTFRGPFRVNFEVHIPLRYDLDATTQAGNIDVPDIEGRVALVTGGGNITVGRVAGRDIPSQAGGAAQTAARLETGGGQITIGDVTGGLYASSAGGHITTGNVEGDATLHTGGGHIHTGRLVGAATLDTGGGNIYVGSAGSTVTANTAGGQIDFGAAAGTIRAHTGGGAVRIDRASGPVVVEATGGSVFLRQADGPLRVSSAVGNITAWFTDTAGPGTTASANGIYKLRGPSQLISGQGDVTVYLSSELAVTIDAVVHQGNAHRIVADPALPLQVSCGDSASGADSLHCQVRLNGGGEVLHLNALAGNILLKLQQPSPWTSGVVPAPWRMPGVAELPSGPSPNPGAAIEDNELGPEGFIEEMRRKFEEAWWGGIPVDSGGLQKLLENPVAPSYPEVARKAGIEGDVVLRVCVSKEGRVTSLRVLDGPPVLARAAMEAVRQWQYQPMKINGRASNVVTTLVLAFRLR